MIERDDVASEASGRASSSSSARKPYEAPRLESFGDARELTLGLSGGTLESGSPPRKGGTDP